MASRRIKRTTFCNWLLGLLLLPVASLAGASQLSFDITGDRINHDSSVIVNGMKATALWTNVPNVITAQAWQPGQLTTALGPRTVTFTGTGGTFDLTVDIRGLQYGGISGNFTRLNASAVPGAPAGDFTSAVMGDGELVTSAAPGFSSTTYVSEKAGLGSITPYTIVRPVFTYSETELLAALNPRDTNAVRPGTGVYRASIPLTYRYRVLYQKNGIWTYESRNFVFNMDVKFLGNVLERIEVTGTGDFLLTYPEDRPIVQGTTLFNVRATGVMPKGLRMRFVDHNRNYHLNASAPGSIAGIPYNLVFQGRGSNIGGMSNRTLVSDGRFLETGGSVVVNSSSRNIEQLLFDLEANFATTDVVPAALYSDTFVVIFDVVIE